MILKNNILANKQNIEAFDSHPVWLMQGFTLYAALFHAPIKS